MRKIKPIIFFLCLCVFLCALFSCADKDSNSDEIFKELMQNTESAPPAEPFASKVYIIIPEKASSALAEAARGLSNEIKEKTSVETVLKYDSEKIDAVSTEVEIYIGRTKHLAVEEAYKNLRMGDYVCKWSRNSIILGGRYEEATLSAIDAFRSSVLVGASNESLMRKDFKLEEKKPYLVNSVNLNGYDLYDYRVLCPEEECKEREEALVLRDAIAKKTGYYLEVAVDTEKSREYGKNIIIERFSGTDGAEAYIDRKNQNVVLWATDAYSLSLAVSDFASLLSTADEEGNSAVEINEAKSYDGKTERFNIGILEEDSTSKTNPEKLLDVNTLLSEDALLVAFDTLSESLEEDFSVMAKIEGYTYSFPDETAPMLIYKNDILKGVEKPSAYNALCYDIQASGGECFRIIHFFGEKCELATLGSLLSKESYNIIISHAELGGADMRLSAMALPAEKYTHKVYCDSRLSAKLTDAESAVLGITLCRDFCDAYESLKNALV